MTELDSELDGGIFLGLGGDTRGHFGGFRVSPFLGNAMICRVKN